MALDVKKTGTSALIALLLATAGGAGWLQTHKNPTLRDVYLSCEKGDLHGIACCEDLLGADDLEKSEYSCGMIRPEDKDPLGIRKSLEDQYDAEHL